MKPSFVEGIVKRHPDGFGFLVCDDQDHPDVYIPKNSMNGVMTNDRVRAEVYPDKADKKRFRGDIVRITKRAFTEIMGAYHDKGNFGIIRDQSGSWGADLKIMVAQAKGAKDGELIRAKILKYPSENQDFQGEVVEVLGKADDAQNDTKRVIHAHRLPFEFSPACAHAAKSMSPNVKEEDFKNRKDLRSTPLITIDGATAKDFDDAVFVETSPRGFHCLVAIADVSHYVKEGAPIDIDAYERGTSTYFPNFVIPMLPEVLSNELCSLKPNVPRLAVVADMIINYEGEIVSSDFYEAVIQSQARVTYGEAQEVVDGNTPDKFKHVEKVILKCADLAKVLMAKRFKDGSLNLEIGETELELDDRGEPIDIIRSERLFAHKLIEELMLIANVAVARFLGKKEGPALYRIHEAPFQESLDLLSRYMVSFGGTKSLSGGSLQKKLTKALQAFEGKPHAEVLNILTLRTMNQAKYSPHNVGHFGLGFEDYAHFTSPIRRYPDLIIHRLIKSVILEPKAGYRKVSTEDLESAGTHLSACEQRSTKAERQFESIKKARFMKPRLGMEFDGIVSSVTKFGIFVLLRQFDVDGLVKIDDLGSDIFVFDEENLRLVGKKNGISYDIGQSVKVLVSNVDIEAGRIDFLIAGVEPRAPTENRQTNRPYDKKRPKTEKDRGGVRKTRVRKSRR